MAGGGSKPGERRGGRKAGTPNKLTKTIKESIEAAFDKVGGVEYLARQAEENPTAFMTLLGKVLPTQVNGDITVIGMPSIMLGVQPDA